MLGSKPHIKKPRTPHTRRTLMQNHDFGNEVAIYSVRGAGNRRMIDTTYEVDALVDRRWQTVGVFTDERLATAFAQGIRVGMRVDS
jgi:hypothetical protein